MYKRIYDSDEIMVDYYNDGKPMIRVSQFYDNHFRDEHFVEIPVDAVEVVRCKDCVKAVRHEVFPWSRRCKVEDCKFSHKGTHFCSYGERRTE